MTDPGARTPYALHGRSLLLLVPVTDTLGNALAEHDPFPRAHALAEALTSAAGNISRCRLLLPGRHTATHIADAVTAAARQASSLIVYATGLLTLDPDQRLALAGAETAPGPGRERSARPGISWPLLSATLATTACPQRLLIADLHATPAVWQHLHRHPDWAPTLLKPAGTALLAHLTPAEPATAPAGFTGTLTRLLRHGDPTAPAELTVAEIATCLRALQPRAAAPRLTIADPDTCRIRFRNPAAPPDAQPVRHGTVVARQAVLATAR